MKISKDEYTHSKIGASSAERWMNCPGSVNLIEKCPPVQPSKYAMEGTEAHSVVETVLRGKKETWELVGEFPDEMLEAADLYAKHVNDLRNGLGVLYVEKDFDLFVYDDRAYGTADAVVVKAPELHVIDFKYGAGYAVEALDNPQLRFYALGALFNLPAEVQEQIKKITIWIVQPRAIHDEGVIRSEVLSIGELLSWGDNVLKPAMAATKPSTAPLCKGKWCRWCPALALCPEQGKMVVADVTLDFMEPEIKLLPKPITLSLEQIADILTVEDQVISWFEAVRNFAKAQLESGSKMPGYKLAKGRASRFWADKELAEKLLIARFGKDAFKRELLSPAAALKAGFAPPDGLIAETVGAPSLVSAKNKRGEYVKASPVNDFKEIDDGEEW